MSPMNRFIHCFLFIALAATVGVPASARDGSGALTFIRAPISTQPQVAASGGSIIVDVTDTVYNSCGCRFHLYLDSGSGRVELTDMARLPDPAAGVYRFSVNTLPGLETGLYDLIAQKGSNHDTALNAVSLVEEFEPKYQIMQIHDPLVDAVTGHNLELVAERAAEEKTRVHRDHRRPRFPAHAGQCHTRPGHHRQDARACVRGFHNG